MDSSKFFYYHVKHRLLLHNLYGIELCVGLLGDFISTSDGKKVPVRDVAAEHCREDLYGTVPTLNDWLKGSDEVISQQLQLPEIQNAAVKAFLVRPFLRSGLQSALLITYSNFGVYLVERFLGADEALELARLLPPGQTVQQLLKSFQCTEKWQYTPDKSELNWLKEQENGQRTN